MGTTPDYPDGRYYWTFVLDADGPDPVAVLVDEKCGVMARMDPEQAERLTLILEAARAVVEVKEEGGDLLGCVDMLGARMAPPEVVE